MKEEKLPTVIMKEDEQLLQLSKMVNCKDKKAAVKYLLGGKGHFNVVWPLAVLQQRE